MKYGERLGVYSVPEWHSHNILYDDLKHQIKELTVSKAAFSEKKYDALVASFHHEIDNTNLFVHCKLGEIEYRFQQCDTLVRYLAQLPKDERKFWQLSGEVQKINQEIRNLSRYIGAQYTGFQKLLKKYRRHAPHQELTENKRDLHEVTAWLVSRGSFARIDLTSQFLELSVLYYTLRTGKFKNLAQSFRNSPHRCYNDDNEDDNDSPSNNNNSNGNATKSKCTNDLANFDLEMLTLATKDVHRFWIHVDNLVQVKVLLLQDLDAIVSPDKEEEDSEVTSILYLDTGDLLSASSSIEPAQVRTVRTHNDSSRSRRILLVPAGGLRHTAAVELTDEQFEAIEQGHLDSKCITSAAECASDVSARLALGWVVSQRAQPITSIKSHITRFKSKVDEVWAAIDASITMTDSQGSSTNQTFPYAVLEIRTKRETEWVRELRHSHLLHPVSNSFSLYTWSLLRKYPNKAAVRPAWLDLLESGKDIRKEPSDIIVSPRINPRKSTASLQFKSSDESGASGSGRHHEIGSAKSSPSSQQAIRYWNEFDDGDEYEDLDGGHFFEVIDEELARARMAANLARPVYKLGETMRRQFYTWFDSNKRDRSGRRLQSHHHRDANTGALVSATSASSESTEDIDAQSVLSDDTVPSETSSLVDQPSRRYSPRIGSRRNPSTYGSIAAEEGLTAANVENLAVRKRNDRGLALITFLSFCISLGIVALVFTILITEDVLLLSSGLRVSLILFLIFALALALLGYVACSFRSSQEWSSQAIVHILLLTVVCVGVGGVANIAVPQV